VDVRADRITLACLDIAGTTVDDGDAVVDAFRSALADQGVAAGSAAMVDAESYVRQTMGSSKIVVFRHLLGGDEARAHAANRTFEAAYEATVSSGGMRPVPGAVDLFARLRDADVRVCLTTGFSARTRDAVLDALGWHDLVDLALSPQDAGRGRPFPDLVLTAILRLGIDDVRDVAVAGDTVSDLWCGTRAGASIVAGVLTGAHDRVTLAAAPHTHVLDSVADLGPLVVPASA
jgi:phosphonatase-like hydrolase